MKILTSVRVGLAASGAEPAPEARAEEKSPTEELRLLPAGALGDAERRSLVASAADPALARRGLWQVVHGPSEPAPAHAHHLRQSHLPEAQGPRQEGREGAAGRGEECRVR